MRKIKVIIKSILNMNFINMFKIVRKVSKKNGNSYLYTLFDVIISGFIYGAGYYDYQEFEFYNLNKTLRKTYLTRLKNCEIIKKYNDRSLIHKFDNKVEFNNIFKDYIKRDFLFINENNFNEFVKFTKNHKTFIAKPIIGEGGIGIEKFIINKETNINKLFEKLLNNNQSLIEEYIIQHKKISELYDKSVNTLRLFTFYDGEKSHLLNSVFKIGNGGVTDNFSSGSMYTFVDDEGKVIVPAIDQDDNVYNMHPITNKNILGFAVPMFKEAGNLVKEAAKVVPGVKYIGWDVAITNKGPVIIEGNSFPGVFQIKPSLSEKKLGLIPEYQKVMEIK